MSDFRFRVPAELAGERLDRIVAACVEGLSRTGARRLIDEGRVRVEGRRLEADDRPGPGAEVEGEFAAPASSTLAAEPFQVPILYEDDFLMVLDKPAGLTVHPGAGRRTGTLVHQLLGSGRTFSAVGAPERPGIVHRLDRETSGCIVVARTDAAHHALAARFRGREVTKEYRALVCGVLRRPRGRIEAPVGRHPQRRTLMSTRSRAGRPALTEYRVLATSGGLSWLALDLRTGRTHQIRVHLSSIEHPVVGDRLYGGGPVRLPAPARAALGEHPRLMLHALRLSFEHPLREGRVDVFAPLPEEIESALIALDIPHEEPGTAFGPGPGSRPGSD